MIDNIQTPSAPKPQIDFTIDASHELALFLWNIDKENHLKLKTVPYFCIHPGSAECAIYARDEDIYCVSLVMLQWE